MIIRLISTTAKGNAVCPATMINGVEVPKRNYGIVDHIAVLTGQSDAVLSHDAMYLLEHGGGVYRPMMPAEQNALRLREEAAQSIEE